MSSVDDTVDTAFLSEFDSNGIYALGECCFQGHRVTRKIAIGISRSPGNFLAMIHHFHSKIGVNPAVTGRESLIHGLCIDEEFES